MSFLAYLSAWARARGSRAWASISLGTGASSGESLQWCQPTRPINLAMIEAGFEAIYRSGGHR